MEYSVAVTETSYGFVEVEANSIEEALELARTEYENGNTIWNNSDESFDVDTPYTDVDSELDTVQLKELWHSHKANCCKCGCELEDTNGCGLGEFFVLDKNGNFYCIDCDDEFEDGDERIFEPEFCEEDGEELANRILSDEDMYNPVTGVYAFHYNDKDAICIYHIPTEKAVELANEARRTGDYWAGLLGAGGNIYDDPNEFIREYGNEAGWITCESFARTHLEVLNDCPYCSQKPVFRECKNGRFYDRCRSSKPFASSCYEEASIGADENGRICLWVCGDDLSDPEPLKFCPECGRKLTDD